MTTVTNVVREAEHPSPCDGHVIIKERDCGCVEFAATCHHSVADVCRAIGFNPLDLLCKEHLHELLAALTGDDRRVLYRSYLQTRRWAQIRTETLAAHDHRCALCTGTDRLQVHHRTYDRIGAEVPADLVVLCRRCHRRHHRQEAIA